MTAVLVAAVAAKTNKKDIIKEGKRKRSPIIMLIAYNQKAKQGASWWHSGTTRYSVRQLHTVRFPVQIQRLPWVFQAHMWPRPGASWAGHRMQCQDC